MFAFLTAASYRPLGPLLYTSKNVYRSHLACVVFRNAFA